MPAEFKITYTLAVPELLLDYRKSQWAWNKIIKETWHKQGIFWHGKFRQKHFTHAGAKEYGYLPRAGQTGNKRKNFWASYTGRKQKTMGHTLPLVWSGESMNLTKIRVIRAKATRTESFCHVVLRSPGFNRKHPDSDINMRDEVTRVSTSEQRTIVDQFFDEIGDRLNRLRGRKTVHIK
jgi:hypothetical protein